MPMISDGLSSNDFFSGGLALAAIAAGVAYMRRYVTLALRTFVVDVEVREWDMVMWLGLWLAHTDYGKRCRKLTTCVLQESGAEASLFFEPGLGPHLFRYDGTWVFVDRRVDKEENVWNRREWYLVRVLGSRAVATKLIEDAKQFGMDAVSRRHTAFISDGKGEWRRLPIGRPRKLSTVILPAGMAEDLEQRCRRFLSSSEWYAARGVPWRLGVLLEGPPGTGKSSIARAIAAELELPFYLLDLAAKEFSDRDLMMTLARVPVGALLMIEDLGPKLGADGGSLVTLGGLLNALDGPLATEGRILFVTTNAAADLDGALVRPGRMDVQFRVDNATRDQARRMFLRFFPDHEAEAAAFADAIPDGVIAPAAIQEHLVARADDAERAVLEAFELARNEAHAVVRETRVA